MTVTVADIGDVVELEAWARVTKTKEPAEGTPSCTVRAPDGTISNPAVTANGGTYTAEVEPDQSGTWRYAFQITGDAKGAAERTFEVRRQRVPRD
jgi:hypothetical protein